MCGYIYSRFSLRSSVPSVLKVFTAFSSRGNSIAFITENTEERRENKIETENIELFLIYLSHPSDRCGGLRAAAGGFFRYGERGNYVPRHIHRSYQRDLAGGVGMENRYAQGPSRLRHEPKL
jgi:hypothetical protein